ncbi:DUF6086 family protein [Streptomyces sp. NPDC057403]|uniref:DUF6086 family protein n=1 Tax=Streptomyces sp. NPDC057403 TaxID=3346119 RepID=UPI003694B274
MFEADVGLASGFGPMERDECRMNPAAFEVFVKALLIQHRRTSHAPLIALDELRIAGSMSSPRGRHETAVASTARRRLFPGLLCVE